MTTLYDAVAALKTRGKAVPNARLRIVSRTLDMHQQETARDVTDTDGFVTVENGVLCIRYETMQEGERIFGTTHIAVSPERASALIERSGEFPMRMPVIRRERSAIDYHTPFGLIKAYTTGLSAEAELQGLQGYAKFAYLLEFQDFKDIMTVEITVSPVHPAD